MQTQTLKTSIAQIAAIILIIGCGVLLSLQRYGTELFIDEARSVQIAQKSLPLIIEEVKKDNHPPFYYFLLALWIKASGNSEAAARGFSLLFFVLGAGVLYYSGRRLLSSRAAALAALALFCLSSISIRHAANARMYTMLAFLAIVSTYFFALRVIYGDKSRAVAAGLLFANLAGIFTHYWFAFIIIAEAVFLAIYSKEKIKEIFFWCAIPVIIFWVNWGPAAVAQSSNGSMDFLRGPVDFGLMRGAIQDFFYNFTGWLVLLLCSAAVFKIVKNPAQAFKDSKEYFSQQSVILLCIIFLTALLVPFFISKFFMPVFMPGRYTILLLAPFTLIIAGFFDRVTYRPLLWGALALFFGFVIIKGYTKPADYSQIGIKKAVAHLGQNMKENDSLMYVGVSRLSADYYFDRLPPIENIYRFTLPEAVEKNHPCWTNDRTMTPALKAEVAQRMAHMKKRNKNARLWVLWGYMSEFNAALAQEMEKYAVPVDSWVFGVTEYEILENRK